MHIRKISSIDVFMDYVVFSDSTKKTIGVYSKWGNYTAEALEGSNSPMFIETSRGVKSVVMTQIAKEKKPLSSSKQLKPCQTQKQTKPLFSRLTLAQSSVIISQTSAEFFPIRSHFLFVPTF